MAAAKKSMIAIVPTMTIIIRKGPDVGHFVHSDVIGFKKYSR